MSVKPLTKSNIQSDRKSNPTEEWFFDGLDKFLKKIQERIIECDKSYDTEATKWKLTKDADKKQVCSDCCIELSYYYDRTLNKWNGWRNGIWIKVHNKNDVNIWLLIIFNKLGKKKVTVFNDCKFSCLLSHTIAYAMPPNFTESGVWYLEKKVKQKTFDVILDEMCCMLNCVCNAKCK